MQGLPTPLSLRRAAAMKQSHCLPVYHYVRYSDGAMQSNYEIATLALLARDDKGGLLRYARDDKQGSSFMTIRGACKDIALSLRGPSYSACKKKTLEHPATQVLSSWAGTLFLHLSSWGRSNLIVCPFTGTWDMATEPCNPTMRSLRSLCSLAMTREGLLRYARDDKEGLLRYARDDKQRMAAQPRKPMFPRSRTRGFF